MLVATTSNHRMKDDNDFSVSLSGKKDLNSIQINERKRNWQVTNKILSQTGTLIKLKI